MLHRFVVKLNICDSELKGVTYEEAVRSLNDSKFLYFCIMCYVCMFLLILEWKDSDSTELQVQSKSEYHLCQ
jgi:hypothetical protein